MNSVTLERIGNLWEKGHCALSQVYMSRRICEELVDALLGPAETAKLTTPVAARLALAALLLQPS